MTDADMIEETLERAAEACDDPAAQVFERFFERCPQARTLFTVLDPLQPPLGCGQMCFEVIQLLRDTAAGQDYVASYMHDVARSHASVQATDPAAYAAFLEALVDVLAGLSGQHWTPTHAAAWERQCKALMKMVDGACSVYP